MKKLMSHLVANYPTAEIAFAAAKALVAGGTDILEIQLPFSDPSADGAAIQNACSYVLKKGATTKDGFDFIAKLHKSFPNVQIALMSYCSLLVAPGIDKFCQKAKEAGVSALIIPDLPFDCDEGLYSACKKYELEQIPVAAPSMTEIRMQNMLDKGFSTIYAALRVGITGTSTTIDEETISFLKRLSRPNKDGMTARIYGGFGINSKEQSEAIFPYVDGVIAGSVFVRIIDKEKDNLEKMSTLLTLKAKEIKGVDSTN
ncbi:MAG: tryptophan synthase subunit alpha [Treponema sp.]|jgi:tryptophan synthase alpha chain|nr:tryptophan synthase subunit alpha [Treponema sp.]